MATRDYPFAFVGSTLSPSGLAPTFITFINMSGSGIVAPGVSSIGSGIYKTSYDATQLIAWTLDGATTSLGSARYIYGSFEPQDQIGITLSGMAATLAGLGGQMATLTVIGSSLSVLPALIGSTASSFGSTSVDPGDIFGMLKRFQEFQEGNQTYAKSTGILDFYSRGSSTLLREKTISDNSTQTTKT